MATDNLNLDTLTASQNDKSTSVNNALERVDDVLGAITSKDISASGTITLTADEAERTRVLQLTGTLTADTTIQFPATVRRTPMILFRDGDNAGFTLTVQGSATETAHVVGEIRLLDGDLVEVMKTDDAASEESLFATGDAMVYVSGTLIGTGAETPEPTDPANDVTFNDADPDTITRGAGSFITEGYVPGMKLLWAGTVSNNNTYVVDAVAATTLTLVSNDAVTGEGPVTATNTVQNEGLGQAGAATNPLLFLADQVVFRQVFSRGRVGFKSGLGGSQARAEVGTSNNARAFDIRKISAATGADTSIGSIDFAALARVATFTFSADVDFEPGDVMEIRAPDTADDNLAEVWFELRGYRH